jgi:glycosyltransferase involved in cell wall biosynthesis
MRIFFLDYSYEPGLGADAGGFRKLWELAAALGRAGHDTLVLYPALPGRVPLRPVTAVSYPVLDARGLRPLSAYVGMVARAWRLARERPPDIVYFRSGLNVLPLALRPLSGARIVLEVNADTVEFMRGEGRPRWEQRLFARVERWAARGSDAVVTLTPGLERMLVERYDVPPSRIHVVPSGTDVDHFVPADATECRRRLGLSPAVFVVGFVGLCYRHQGVPTLLDALARLRRDVPGLHGLVVGDGVMREAWERHARERDVADIVRFAGHVPYSEVHTWLGAMDVVSAPFTADRGETSPFKVLDAMACARPVVASDLESVRWLAKQSDALTLVPPDDADALADALRALAADPRRRADLGARGRAYACAHHSWDRLATALQPMLAGAGSRARAGARA